MVATHVRQRGSRNKKKNMRTRIDISDVEALLDDLRHDERTGYYNYPISRLIVV